jgi:hypothetical protein
VCRFVKRLSPEKRKEEHNYEESAPYGGIVVWAAEMAMPDNGNTVLDTNTNQFVGPLRNGRSPDAILLSK